MSATNRGAVRKADDFYATPTWLTEAIVPHLKRYIPKRILEPAAGEGAITQVLARVWPDAQVVAGDIRTGQDIRTHKYDGLFDLVITNPPFLLAVEFIQRGLPLRSKGGALVLLMRLNILGGQERADFWRTHGPAKYASRRVVRHSLARAPTPPNTAG
jgi:hypothetical protein